MGGFESTKLPGPLQDVLGTTRHIERWREDLQMLLSAGIRNLRYSAPWHRIEKTPGEFDFSWLDQPMRFMKAAGMNPILDLVHHVSFPDWLTGGFSDDAYEPAYLRYVEKVARRYEWTPSYTLFNEPLPTTLLCSYSAVWPPLKPQTMPGCEWLYVLHVPSALQRGSFERSTHTPPSFTWIRARGTPL
jgi:beta-glucosidase/6-phospho-beta-glucosidase/beta-galactosidase